MTAELSRRALFARLRGGGAQLRPPWSRSEAEFTERCSQCGNCFEACPTGVVVRGHAGFPIVDFTKAHCTFCGACAAACKDGCFDTTEGRAAWSIKAAIGDGCLEPKGVACRVCQDACEPSAIRFKPQLGGRSAPFLDGDSCTGCGGCVASCPVSAISVVKDRSTMVNT